MRNSLLTILLLALFLISCSQELTPQEYIKYVQSDEQAYMQNKSEHKVVMSVLLKPNEYVLAKELDKNVAINDADNRLDELSDYTHFNFRFSHIEGKDMMKYSEQGMNNHLTRINYFAFDVKDDFFILQDSDTFKCVSSLFVRDYNLNPSIDLALSFESIKETEDFDLIYKDKQFDLGRVKFSFDKKLLLNKPKLKI